MSPESGVSDLSLSTQVLTCLTGVAIRFLHTTVYTWFTSLEPPYMGLPWDPDQDTKAIGTGFSPRT